jgi:hypothetical protein
MSQCKVVMVKRVQGSGVQQNHERQIEQNKVTAFEK